MPLSPSLRSTPALPFDKLRSRAVEGVNSAKGQNSELWAFACPTCRAPLEWAGPDELRCPIHGNYPRIDGIWRMLPPERAAYFAPFLRDYTAIRSAEGYGYDDSERYRRLPEAAADDPLAWQWRMRARSFAELGRRVLEPMERIHEETRRNTKRDQPFVPLRVPSWIDPGLRVLDMGSGVGWLSHQLARLGHMLCAVDLNLDERDGLAAARHYPASWPLLQAEFDCLPLMDAEADVVVFNAALPYSSDYRATLAEALRVLRPGGQIVVMDSPIYRSDASGRQMVAERQAAFARIHGTRSDALPSIGYLTWDMLGLLGRDLGLRWRTFSPWYGWRWALRPWRARLLRQREPSAFALLVAERSNI